MKLSSAQIEVLEALLTAREGGETSQAASLRIGIRDAGGAVMSHFHMVLRAIGIDAKKPSRKFVLVPASDAAAFQEFLAEKRRREANSANAP